MQKLTLWLLVGLTLAPATVLADEFVKGYVRRDGTYVQPHWRSSPDRSPYNNWSFPGNVNPHTGKVAPGNSDTYLDRYYGPGIGTGGTGTGGTGSLPTLPSLPALPKYAPANPAVEVYRHTDPGNGNGLSSIPFAPLPSVPSFGGDSDEDEDNGWNDDGDDGDGDDD